MIINGRRRPEFSQAHLTLVRHLGRVQTHMVHIVFAQIKLLAARITAMMAQFHVRHFNVSPSTVTRGQLLAAQPTNQRCTKLVDVLFHIEFRLVALPRPSHFRRPFVRRVALFAVVLQTVRIRALFAACVTVNGGMRVHRFLVVAELPALVERLLTFGALVHRRVDQMGVFAMDGQVAPVAVTFPAVLNVAHVLPLDGELGLLVDVRVLVGFQLAERLVGGHAEFTLERFIVPRMARLVLQQFDAIGERVLAKLTAHHKQNLLLDNVGYVVVVLMDAMLVDLFQRCECHRTWIAHQHAALLETLVRRHVLAQPGHAIVHLFACRTG